MGYIDKTDSSVVGERKVDVSRGECRTDLNAQWSTRPDDQRFLSLEDLYASVVARRQSSFEALMRPGEIRLVASREDSEGLRLETADRQITPTNYSFGQLCQLAKAPAGYLRGMHAFRAATNLQADLLSRAEDRPIKLYGESQQLTARAFTGPDYGRIYDTELVAAIQRFAGTGSRWKVPGAMNWSTGSYNPYVDVTKETTTLYASDRDVWLFLVDDTHPIEIGKLPNGDPDLVFRGFYAYNSEVGARSLGIATFMLRGVCGNRCMWGVEDFDCLRVVHSKHGGMRFSREAAPALERYATSDPSKMLAGITAARNAVVAKTDEERIEFLSKKSGLDISFRQAMNIIETCEREEHKKPENVWDFVQGLTAVARTIPNQDNRLELEKVGAKLMSRATRGAI